MADRKCIEPDCVKPVYLRDMCRPHYTKAYGANWSRGNPEARKARERAKVYRRRMGNRLSDVTPEYERMLREKAKRCPLCRVQFVNEPYLPASRELDHIVPLAMGGTHTIGNVRIICRACNHARPKDGSDYTGPVTLWAEQPGFIPPKLKPVKPQQPPRPAKQDRTADGVSAARMRADGMTWRWIVERLNFKSEAEAKCNAEKHGLPEDVARWPDKRTTCYTCGSPLPETQGPGRPRKYCKACADAKLWYPSLYVTSGQ